MPHDPHAPARTASGWRDCPDANCRRARRCRRLICVLPFITRWPY
jgi:hypothetical protein